MSIPVSLAFTNREFLSNLCRYVFARGDHVRFTSGGDNDQMGCIDQIFVHTMERQGLFILITPIKVLDDTDTVLGLHKVHYRQSEPIIIGINSLIPTRLYIVTIDNNTTVWVDWQVEWL
jgi:hypothetical protein